MVGERNVVFLVILHLVRRASKKLIQLPLIEFAMIKTPFPAASTVYMYICMYVYVCMYVCMYMYVCVCMYVRGCMYNMCTYVGKVYVQKYGCCLSMATPGTTPLLPSPREHTRGSHSCFGGGLGRRPNFRYSCLRKLTNTFTPPRLA